MPANPDAKNRLFRQCLVGASIQAAALWLIARYCTIPTIRHIAIGLYIWVFSSLALIALVGLFLQFAQRSPHGRIARCFFKKGNTL
jgi:hypothetical protein